MEPLQFSVVMFSCKAQLIQTCCVLTLYNFHTILTRLSLGSFLWHIGKQYSPRCDCRMRHPVRGYSVCLEEFHPKMKQKFKITPGDPQNDSGLSQLIMMGKSIHQKLFDHMMVLCVCVLKTPCSKSYSCTVLSMKRLSVY